MLGDWFDPYIDIDIDTMIERYNEFVKIWKSDDRIISVLGNHDLAGYIIQNDCTNRTVKFYKDKQRKLDSINAELKINDDDHEILGDEQEEKDDKNKDKNSPERC